MRTFGSIFAVLGAIFAFLAVLVVFDDEKDRGAMFGFLMFAAVFGFPGGLALWTARQREHLAEIAAYLRTHDRFAVAEIAKKIGQTELETERLIARIVSRGDLDLVFHRADRTYVHRARLGERARVVERCGACGAAVPRELVLEDEAVACTYCGKPLA